MGIFRAYWPHAYSIDIDHSLLDPKVHRLKPKNLTFLEGDCYKIEVVLPPRFLQSLPHPWVIVEDAHANSFGVLEHFHEFMKEGDYIIYDDTDPVPGPIVHNMHHSDNTTESEVSLGIEKHNTITKFMTKYDCFYAVDSFFTDIYVWLQCHKQLEWVHTKNGVIHIQNH